MSIRAFNQSMDLYYREHPEPDDASMKKRIRRCADANSAFGFISSGNIFPSEDNVLVLKHPFVADDHSVHSHDYFELIYISRGNCIQNINGIRQDLKEGDICLLNPDDRHSISIRQRENLLFNIMIKPSLFQESFLCFIAENDLISRFFLTSLFNMSKENSYLYFPRHENSQSGSIIQSLILEFHEKRLGYRKTVECYLALLFTELLRTHKDRIDREHAELMGNHQLSSILAYMNLHKCEATLQSVAEAFHYHPNYLSALIKKHTNKSFSELMQEAKLNEVCYYLKNTNMPMEEIIQLMGYYDRSYLNRVFKRHFHMTPGDYRQKHTRAIP